MSLDVYLTRKRWISYDEGKTYEVDNENVYSANITHNLGEMADRAGIYEALWRPHRLMKEYDVPEGDYNAEWDFEDSVVITASDIIPILEKGLEDLKSRPEYFKEFDSPNGWGLYIHFVPFVEKYLEACKEYPNSSVEVSR